MSTQPGAVDVRRVTTREDLAAAYEIREDVFVAGQGVPLELERDVLDRVAVHVLARRDGQPVATGRLVARDDGVGVLGRIAVIASERGTGLGVAVMRALEDNARELGLDRIELHAQTHALAFYQRLGYSPVGEEYVEAGIPHLSMDKPL
ncbi:MAG TPA: GNAT family N-acetyltransferase [Acidothermales bacterium]